MNLDKERGRMEAIFENSIDPKAIIAKLETMIGRKIDPEECIS